MKPLQYNCPPSFHHVMLSKATHIDASNIKHLLRAHTAIEMNERNVVYYYGCNDPYVFQKFPKDDEQANALLLTSALN